MGRPPLNRKIEAVGARGTWALILREIYELGGKITTIELREKSRYDCDPSKALREAERWGVVQSTCRVTVGNPGEKSSCKLYEITKLGKDMVEGRVKFFTVRRGAPISPSNGTRPGFRPASTWMAPLPEPIQERDVAPVPDKEFSELVMRLIHSTSGGDSHTGEAYVPVVISRNGHVSEEYYLTPREVRVCFQLQGTLNFKVQVLSYTLRLGGREVLHEEKVNVGQAYERFGAECAEKMLHRFPQQHEGEKKAFLETYGEYLSLLAQC